MRYLSDNRDTYTRKKIKNATENLTRGLTARVIRRQGNSPIGVSRHKSPTGTTIFRYKNSFKIIITIIKAQV